MMNCPDINNLIRRLETTDSTNNLLASLCDAQPLPEFTTVWAENQTAGKGQRGNSWESEYGKNLLFSTVCYPDTLPARHQFLLSMALSLAVCDTLSTYTGSISIKWPNDIYWKDKKICGILIENELQGTCIARCIAGIGINVNQTNFRSSAPNPVSLKHITGQDIDRNMLLTRFLEHFIPLYQALRNQPDETAARLHQRYLEHLYRRNGLYPYADENGTFQARILTTEPDGHLLLEDENGQVRRYAFKEVQYIHQADMEA